MAERIKVRGVGQDGQVILHERHEDHPDGEVFITANAEAEVARTPAVNQRIRDGLLVPASEKAPAPKPTAPKPTSKGEPNTTSADPAVQPEV